jgi:large subunit ribosomal protein L4
MPEIEIKDRNNTTVGTMQLDDAIFSAELRPGILHDTIVNYLANQRQGTHATKTRGLVSGGGKKPYKQKSTGRARAGSNRSPVWRSGGTIFGPQPRDYSYTIPKKVRKLALRTALSEKLSGNGVVIIDTFSMEKPKTKEMVDALKKLGISQGSVLIVLADDNSAVYLSARNIPGVAITRASELNSYDVIKHHMLLMTKKAVQQLESMYRI